MQVKIGTTDYTFKTAFAEFTFAEYIPIAKAYGLPVMQRLTTYTGIPGEVLNGLGLENIAALCELVQGLENEGVLLALSKPFEGVHVGLESYGKIEAVKRRVADRHILDALPDIVEIYTGVHIADKPLLDVYGMAAFYLESVTKFFNKYKRLGDSKYTDEELEAGVEVFEGFGHFTTVVKIGRERGMSNDEVLALSAEEVYMELLLDFERSEFEKNLHEIQKRNQEHFSKVS